MTDSSDKHYFRLSDKILEALKLSLEQSDITMSELLTRGLEMAMTRGAGGKDFTERREFSAEVEQTLARLDALKKEARGL
jgi:hypothetical protein